MEEAFYHGVSFSFSLQLFIIYIILIIVLVFNLALSWARLLVFSRTGDTGIQGDIAREIFLGLVSYLPKVSRVFYIFSGKLDYISKRWMMM